MATANDPTLSLAMSDFQIRVAEYLGIAYYGADGQGIAQVPINAHDLDLTTRLVQDGYRRFVSENPKWNVLDIPYTMTFVSQISGTAISGSGTTLVDGSIAGVYADSFFVGWGLRVTHAADGVIDTFVVTAYVGATGAFTFVAGTEVVAAGDSYATAKPPAVGGQNYRYLMPSDFYGIVLAPWTYEIGGPRLTIGVVAESEIRELRAGANTAGTPSVCAFRPLPVIAGTAGGRWETLFWPAPASNYSLTLLYKRFPQQLVASTDRTVFGFQHDDAILAAMISEAERQRGDGVGPREQAYQDKLAKALMIDARASMSRSKNFGDRSEDRGGGRPLSYYGLDTYGGMRIP